jgi:hypothetical protein
MHVTATELREIIRYAPPAGKTAKGLAGWILPDGTQVCPSCAARIFGRGFTLPRGSTAQWDDSGLPIQCETC